MKKKICPCGEKSLPGLITGVALCQKHYNGLMFGSGKEHQEALNMLAANRNKK